MDLLSVDSHFGFLKICTTIACLTAKMFLLPVFYCPLPLCHSDLSQVTQHQKGQVFNRLNEPGCLAGTLFLSQSVQFSLSARRQTKVHFPVDKQRVVQSLNQFVLVRYAFVDCLLPFRNTLNSQLGMLRKQQICICSITNLKEFQNSQTSARQGSKGFLQHISSLISLT